MNAFAPAQLGNAVLTAHTGKNDPDLFLGTVFKAGSPLDVPDKLIRLVLMILFLPHIRSFQSLR